MSEYITVTERTLEDALTEAKIILGAASDEIEYEIIEKGSTGFLGMGAKNAVIKVRKIVPVQEETEAPVAEEPKAVEKAAQALEQEVVSEKPKKKERVQKPAEKKVETVPVEEPAPKKEEKVNVDEAVEQASSFLTMVFKDLDMTVSITSDYNGQENMLTLDLSGDEMGLLIGKRGQTLDSLQYLTSLVVNKGKPYYVHIKLDTENYRERRKATLENLAKNISAKVKRTKRAVSLEPMNPYERRIIHYALQSDKMVTTHSEGEEPYRKIIVSLKRR